MDLQEQQLPTSASEDDTNLKDGTPVSGMLSKGKQRCKSASPGDSDDDSTSTVKDEKRPAQKRKVFDPSEAKPQTEWQVVFALGKVLVQISPNKTALAFDFEVPEYASIMPFTLTDDKGVEMVLILLGNGYLRMALNLKHLWKDKPELAESSETISFWGIFKAADAGVDSPLGSSSEAAGGSQDSDEEASDMSAQLKRLSTQLRAAEESTAKWKKCCTVLVDLYVSFVFESCQAWDYNHRE